jgi:glucokinase
VVADWRGGLIRPRRLDIEKGLTTLIPNFPGHWIDVPIKALLESHLHVPVYIMNDVRAITYGEWALARAKAWTACFALPSALASAAGW